jgi:NAD(P)-dependent dehydrogenase (short-subunit alcohol dehydrogenase family)
MEELAYEGLDSVDFSRSNGIDVCNSVSVARAYSLFRPPPPFLVVSAGIIAPGHPFPRAPLDEWKNVLDVNVTGAFIVASEHARRLQSENLPGRIVLLGSPSGRRPSMDNLAYGVSKAAVAALGIGLAQGLEQYGIKVYTLCPSHVDTPMLRARGFDDLGNRKLLQAAEVAREIVRLLLDDQYLDGQPIYMGGEVEMKQR